MYRYYQNSEQGFWKTADDPNPDCPWEICKSTGAVRVSVLAISKDVDLADLDEEIEYAGPLFFDIDDKDITVALASAVTLCNKLFKLGVDKRDVEIHLSGSKGVHIYIHPKVFMEENSYQHLPEVHAKMAMHLWVDGMDFQVYSGMKGRLVRPANALRPDGKYKVRVSYEELLEVTQANYKHYVECPRSDKEWDCPIVWSANLNKLFMGSLKSLTKPRKAKEIPDQAMAKLGGSIPHCVQLISDGKRVKDKADQSTSFNNLCMQIGCWSKTAAVEEVVLESLHDRIAKNNPSSSGEAHRSRVNKLKSMHLYLKSQDKYKFSCAAIKKLIEVAPNCMDCPVTASEDAGSVSEALFLFEHAGQYYSDRDRTTLVAPFSLQREYMVIDELNNRIKCSVMTVKVPLTGNVYTIDDFSEDSFVSKLNLKKALSGLEGVGFFGSDNDVTKLRMTLALKDLLSGAEVKQVMIAHAIGLRYDKRSGPENPRDKDHKGRFTYIENDWSITNVGVYNHYILDKHIKGSPKLRLRPFDTPLSPQANEAFSLLCKVNTKDFISSALGWFFASHLKTHVGVLENKFPLLVIYGVAGTGKNSTVALFMRLAGVEGDAATNTIDAPNATLYPFQAELSQTYTIPRVVNEFNPKSVSQHRYTEITEVLKASFDLSEVKKGVLGGGKAGAFNASVGTLKLTAPVVVLAEEPIDKPALQHRSITLGLTPAGLQSGKKCFTQLNPRADDLVDIGRVLIREALGTSLREVSETLDSVTLPEAVEVSDIPERLKFGYKVLLVAYEWALKKLEESGLSDENLIRLRELRDFFRDSITENILRTALDSGFTEVDKILKDLAIMAHHSSNSSGSTPAYSITKGVHYALVNNILYLDVITLYPLLQVFKRNSPTPLAIFNDTSFLKSSRSMDYFMSDDETTKYLAVHGRPVLTLDAGTMKTKGIPVEMFI